MSTITAGVASSRTAYEQLLEHHRALGLISTSASLLGWDQEVMMPPGGLDYRVRQLSHLARLRHDLATDPRIGDWLSACESDADFLAQPHSVEAVNVREMRREYDRETKLPATLVTEFAAVTARAKHEWADARKTSDFPRFEPWLRRIVELCRQQAACYGYAKDGEPWDALAEGYEPGCTAQAVTKVFTPLRQSLVKLIAELTSSRTKPKDALAGIALPIAQQETFVRMLASAVGFDFSRGRLDRSTHPFCSGTHCNDVRMTTRFHEHKLLDAVGSTLHETGHGLYEQGLPYEHVDTPMGSAVSLSIHESQSRLWENFVGRSRSFWQWALPKLKQQFGSPVAHLSLQDVYASANLVQPSLIRVESDEATYNLHIMIRFELERALLRGDLSASDLPGAWNTAYRDYLGLEVPDHARGCMQDIHWSMGALGYFPTYTLGNLYAAQFFEAASQEIPGLEEQFAQGHFDDLLHWLRLKIHSQGRRYRSAELCEHVTGQPPSAEPLIRHLEKKLLPLHAQ